MSPVLSLIQISGQQYVLQFCASVIVGDQIAGLDLALAAMTAQSQRLQVLTQADPRLAAEVAAVARIADPMQRALAATRCISRMRAMSEFIAGLPLEQSPASTSTRMESTSAGTGRRRIRST